MKESKFQTGLKKSAELQGGVGFKLNPQWTVGLADLFLCTNAKPTFIETKVSDRNIETKDGKIVGARKPFIPINMTEIQRARMKKLQRAGTKAAWCVAYKMNGDWYAIFGVDPMASAVIPTFSTNIIVRNAHDKWDVDSMLQRIHNPLTIWDETRYRERPE